MNYKLRFHELALKEWGKLDGTAREQFKKKLAKRLIQPRVLADALSGMPDCYRIKLRKTGYRLVYRVENDILSVSVVVIGKRNKLKVYQTAQHRIN